MLIKRHRLKNELNEKEQKIVSLQTQIENEKNHKQVNDKAHMLVQQMFPLMQQYFDIGAPSVTGPPPSGTGPAPSGTGPPPSGTGPPPSGTGSAPSVTAPAPLEGSSSRSGTAQGGKQAAQDSSSSSDTHFGIPRSPDTSTSSTTPQDSEHHPSEWCPMPAITVRLITYLTDTGEENQLNAIVRAYQPEDVSELMNIHHDTVSQYRAIAVDDPRDVV